MRCTRCGIDVPERVLAKRDPHRCPGGRCPFDKDFTVLPGEPRDVRKAPQLPAPSPLSGQKPQ